MFHIDLNKIVIVIVIVIVVVVVVVVVVAAAAVVVADLLLLLLLLLLLSFCFVLYCIFVFQARREGKGRRGGGKWCGGNERLKARHVEFRDFIFADHSSEIIPFFLSSFLHYLFCFVLLLFFPYSFFFSILIILIILIIHFILFMHA